MGTIKIKQAGNWMSFPGTVSTYLDIVAAFGEDDWRRIGDRRRIEEIRFRKGRFERRIVYVPDGSTLTGGS